MTTKYPLSGQPVEPTNGTGLLDAMHHCGCHQCIHDKAFQEALAAEDEDPPDGCKILDKIATGDFYHPPEWTYGDDGFPRCSEFVLDEDENHYKAPESACRDLFSGIPE